MKKFLLVAATLISIEVSAQDTYQQVYALFQAKCTATCHNTSGNPDSLDLYQSKVRYALGTF